MTAPTFVHPRPVSAIMPRNGRGDFTVADLIRSMVDGLEALPESACWPCPGGSRNAKGYGQVWYSGRMVRGHRASLAWSLGLESDRDLPKDLTVDHLCRVRACVNPRHMELVSAEVNNNRAGTPVARNRAKAVCPRGHELVGSNLVARADGYRACNRCHRAHDAARDLMRSDNPSPYGTIVPDADKRGIIAEVKDSVGDLPNISADQSASLSRALAHTIIRARYDVPTTAA